MPRRPRTSQMHLEGSCPESKTTIEARLRYVWPSNGSALSCISVSGILVLWTKNLFDVMLDIKNTRNYDQFVFPTIIFSPQTVRLPQSNLSRSSKKSTSAAKNGHSAIS